MGLLCAPGRPCSHQTGTEKMLGVSLCVSQKLPCCCGFGCCPSDGPNLPQVLGSLPCIRVPKCLLEQEPLEVSVECAQGVPAAAVAVMGYSPMWGGLWRPP